MLAYDAYITMKVPHTIYIVVKSGLKDSTLKPEDHKVLKRSPDAESQEFI